jgi:hypothetical protein
MSRKRALVITLVAAGGLAAVAWPVAAPGSCGRIAQRHATLLGEMPAPAAPDGNADAVVALSTDAVARVLTAHLDQLEASLNERIRTVQIPGAGTNVAISADFESRRLQLSEQSGRVGIVAPLLATITITATEVPLVGELQFSFEVTANLNTALALVPRNSTSEVQVRVGTGALTDLRIMPPDTGPLLRGVLNTAQQWLESAVRTLLPEVVADVPVYRLGALEIREGQPALQAQELRLSPDRAHLLIGFDAHLAIDAPAAWPTDIPAANDLTVYLAPELARAVANTTLLAASQTENRFAYIHHIDATGAALTFDTTIARTALPCAALRAPLTGQLTAVADTPGENAITSLDINPDIDWTVEQGGLLARFFAPSDATFEHMFATSAGPLLDLVVLPLPTGVDVQLQAREVSASSGWVAVSAGLGRGEE